MAAVTCIVLAPAARDDFSAHHEEHSFLDLTEIVAKMCGKVCLWWTDWGDLHHMPAGVQT